PPAPPAPPTPPAPPAPPAPGTIGITEAACCRCPAGSCPSAGCSIAGCAAVGAGAGGWPGDGREGDDWAGDGWPGAWIDCPPRAGRRRIWAELVAKGTGWRPSLGSPCSGSRVTASQGNCSRTAPGLYPDRSAA